jgi:hypothetical protein
MSEFGYEAENMVPAPAGAATARAIFTTENGILLAYGLTMPVDGTAGYSPACLFLHVDGGDNTMLYVNEGSATSCDFNAVTAS